MCLPSPSLVIRVTDWVTDCPAGSGRACLLPVNWRYFFTTPLCPFRESWLDVQQKLRISMEKRDTQWSPVGAERSGEGSLQENRLSPVSWAAAGCTHPSWLLVPHGHWPPQAKTGKIRLISSSCCPDDRQFCLQPPSAWFLVAG